MHVAAEGGGEAVVVPPSFVVCPSARVISNSPARYSAWRAIMELHCEQGRCSQNPGVRMRNLRNASLEGIRVWQLANLMIWGAISKAATCKAAKGLCSFLPPQAQPKFILIFWPAQEVNSHFFITKCLPAIFLQLVAQQPKGVDDREATNERQRVVQSKSRCHERRKQRFLR